MSACAERWLQQCYSHAVTGLLHQALLENGTEDAQAGVLQDLSRKDAALQLKPAQHGGLQLAPLVKVLL